jgi:pimeloyl-ACP methyl ester carboxylesterase
MSRESRQTSSVRQSRWALPWIAALATLILLAGPGRAIAAGPCDGQTHFDWMGASVSQAITIPSLVQPNGNTSYAGTILAPADESAYPGPRPVVLIQHGLGGTQCADWWAAQDLAGHGYVAVVWTAPQGSSTSQAFGNAVDAMRSALAFSRTAANPYLARSDTGRVALAGHSLGSVVASFVQQDPDPGIRAVIALDTLRRWINGDPGGAVFECAAAEAGEIIPRVPALGFAMDQPCVARPDYSPPDLKLAGFLRWRDAGVPVMELDMAGYNHLDFATPGSEDKHRVLSYFMEAWLSRWLLGDISADRRLLADTVLGVPTASLLSTQFLSGAFLPGEVDAADYRGFLTDTKAPNTKRVGGPTGLIRPHRVRFRFSSDDPEAAFECRLDRGSWKGCESPRRIGRAKLVPGRHRFEVRATDPRGNVEKKPAVWRFRVSSPRG